MLKAAPTPLAKGWIKDLLRNSDLIGIVPFKSLDGLQVTGTRWQTIPSVGWRKLGGGYTESTGNVEEIVETMFQLGGDVKIDRVSTKVKNYVQDPLQTAMQQKAASVAFNFNNAFVNGDNAVPAFVDAFEGVKKRNSNMPARMTINLYGVDVGDGYPILKDVAHMNTFLDALHQAVQYVPGATHILCNEQTLLGLGKLYRRLGLLETTTDAYGRVWNSFRNIPLVDVGLLADKSTEVITNSEDPGDAGNDCTSLYVVALNTDNGLHAIQLSGTSPNPYDPLNGAEMEAGPQFLRRIDWTVGLFNLSQYSILRLKGFRVAAA